MKYYFIIAAFVINAIQMSDLHAQGFLGVSGTKIVNTNGEILLRGIGLGGWLVPEGYMLQTSGFANSPTEIRNKIASLIGTANTDSFFTLYRNYYVTRKDIDRIAQWGFNSIRLPMHYALLTPKNQPNVYLESGFALIDSLLSWCEANKLYLILDLHCAPGGQNTANISDYISSEPSLWQSVDNQNRTIALWKKIAERYAHKEWIGGYDLLNETVWTFGTPAPPLMNLRELFIAITNAIRQVDTSHIVFIEGNNWATDFSGLTPAWDAKLVYSFHKYWNMNDFGSISSYLSLRASANRPLWLGESGENSNQWFAECIALLESNNIGWAWWPHKKIGSISGPLSATATSGYNTLLKYWNGQGAAPSVTFAVNALFDQAYMLSIDLCRYQPDVIDAILRQPFSDETRPFTENRVPGYVFAVNYDIGKMPFAYKDNDYQNTGGSSSYNSGWAFRNDGVDIESCTDATTNGYSVGWIGDNEFLRFSLNVQQTALYQVNLRVGSLNGGGQILMQVDDTLNIGGIISIEPTGGWKNWTTVSAGTIALTAGKHKLRTIFVKGGFNLNHIQFVQITDVRKNEGQIPAIFSVHQNFPNPFNPATIINYTLPHSGDVALEIFDLLGRQVGNLAQGTQTAGNHTVELNTGNVQLPSGVYLYRICFDGLYSQTMKAILMR
jgi:hypothetical protein